MESRGRGRGEGSGGKMAARKLLGISGKGENLMFRKWSFEARNQ